MKRCLRQRRNFLNSKAQEKTFIFFTIVSRWLFNTSNYFLNFHPYYLWSFEAKPFLSIYFSGWVGEKPQPPRSCLSYFHPYSWDLLDFQGNWTALRSAILPCVSLVTALVLHLMDLRTSLSGIKMWRSPQLKATECTFITSTGLKSVKSEALEPQTLSKNLHLRLQVVRLLTWLLAIGSIEPTYLDRFGWGADEGWAGRLFLWSWLHHNSLSFLGSS